MELFQVPKAARTRWATWENPDGRQGGADIGYGRKNSPAITNMRAGACYTLAHAEEGGTVGASGLPFPIATPICSRTCVYACIGTVAPSRR